MDDDSRLLILHSYKSWGDGKCICTELPKALRKCRMNGTCTLPAGETCETAQSMYWGARLGTAAAPVVTMISRGVAGSGGRVPREKNRTRGIYSDEVRIRAAFKAAAEEYTPVKSPATSRGQGFALVTERILSGFYQAKALAELPAEPVPTLAPRMKFCNFGRPKAGKKKAGFKSRRLWLKSQRRRKAGTQEF